MKIIDDCVQGPFKNEQAFKQAVLKSPVFKDAGFSVFEIENEEKEPGMPDVLAMHYDFPAFFIEFKYADKNGVIEFRKSQPLFYKHHQGIRIEILAWDGRKGGRIVYMKASEVTAAKSLRIKIPEVMK
jgi:hypothetical protein